MKKTFIILAALAGSVLTAADCRAQATSISPFPDMEIECLGTELDGTETLRVQGKAPANPTPSNRQKRMLSMPSFSKAFATVLTKAAT